MGADSQLSEEIVAPVRESGREMKLLYDAFRLVKRNRLRKQNAYELLKDSLILRLTKYEIGNALWKEALLQKRISVEEAFKDGPRGRVLKVMKPWALNDDLALRLAYELRRMFYGASYLVASEEK